MATAYLCALLLAVSVAGVAVDDRVINGEAAWLKPAKFALSLAIYNVTLAWLLSLVTAGGGCPGGSVRSSPRWPWPRWR